MARRHRAVTHHSSAGCRGSKVIQRRLRGFGRAAGGFQPLAELSPLRNLAAALFRLENSQTAEEARGVVQQLAEWLKSPEMEGLSRAFAVWLGQVVLPSRLPGAPLPALTNLQEVNRVIEERSRDWFRPVREEGRKEGEAAVLLLLLERRFGPLDERVRERVVGADSDTLLRWAETILTARRVEDVLRD